MAFFTPESIERLYDELHLARRACNSWKERLVFKKFKSNKAKEFGHHGIARRLEMLTAAVEHVFDLIPPDCDVVPEEKNRILCELSLQAFWINASGCLDNLAWLWILENDVKGQNGKPLKGVDIGLMRKQVRDTLPPKITAYLASIDEWLNLLTEYRDTLAHRIPPYIPPFSVDPGSSELYSKIESDMRLALLAKDLGIIGLTYQALALA